MSTIKRVNHKDVLIPTNKSKYKDLCVSLYYNNEYAKKYYWASIMPCSIGEGWMESSPLDGKSEMILRVENRRSKKTDAQAIALFDAAMPRYLSLFQTEEQKAAAEACNAGVANAIAEQQRAEQITREGQRPTQAALFA